MIRPETWNLKLNEQQDFEKGQNLSTVPKKNDKDKAGYCYLKFKTVTSLQTLCNGERVKKK